MVLAYFAEDLDFVLSQTPEFWPRFSGARLLLTGGTGFIGSWLVQTLQRANDRLGSGLELTVLARNPEQARQQHPCIFDRTDTHLVQGDVSQALPPLGPLDLCIHAATDVGDPGKAGNPLQQFASIVGGTRRVLDVAQAGGAKRFLLVSSGAIYGPQPADLERIHETYTAAPSPLLPAQAYGNGKRAAEWLACAYAAQAAQTGLEASIARIFAVIGPGLPFNGPFAAGNFIRDALTGKTITIQGDGRPLRSFLYMSDLCIWLLRILGAGRSGDAYNVGGERAVSIATLAQQVAVAAGTATPIDIRTPAHPDVAPPRYLPDTSKARQELSLQDYTPLDAALRKTIAWTRASGIPISQPE
jgi:nucleoside-diphosphate-sugar epimerase